MEKPKSEVCRMKVTCTWLVCTKASSVHIINWATSSLMLPFPNSEFLAADLSEFCPHPVTQISLLKGPSLSLTSHIRQPYRLVASPDSHYPILTFPNLELPWRDWGTSERVAVGATTGASCLFKWILEINLDSAGIALLFFHLSVATWSFMACGMLLRIQVPEKMLFLSVSFLKIFFYFWD